MIPGICAFAAASFIAAWAVTKAYADRRIRVAASLLIAAGGGVSAYAAAGAADAWVAIAVTLAAYSALSMAAAYDFRLKLIPNVIPLALVFVRAGLFVVEFLCFADAAAHLISSIGGCAVSFALLAVSAKLSKGGVGAGDVKLVSALGFACGFGFVLSVLLLALILCAATGGALLLLKKAGRKDSLPFAPFVWGGFVLLMVFSAL